MTEGTHLYTSIEDFEAELRRISLLYLRSLSPAAPQQLDRIRLELAGAGVSVIYDNTTGGAGTPTLVVSMTPTNPGRR